MASACTFLTMENRTITLLRLDNTTIHLACGSCDRDDINGITPGQLEQAEAQGWTDIEKVQSYDDSTQTFDNPDNAPAGGDSDARGNSDTHQMIGRCNLPGHRLSKPRCGPGTELIGTIVACA